MMKVYLAYPNPMGKNAQVGHVYNDGGDVLWDCRCGAKGLLAGGLSSHECFATREETAAHQMQRDLEKVGKPTDHFNIFDIPDEKIPAEFIHWLKSVGEW